MKQILFIFLIGFTTCTYAQFESSTKLKGIPPVNIKPKEKKDVPPVDTSTIIPPKIYKNPNAQSPPNQGLDYRPNVKSEISMIPKDEFINLGDEVRDKLNNSVNRSLVNSGLKEDDSYITKTDVDFGVIRTNSEYLIIKIRDIGAIDGDFIDVTLMQDYIRKTVASKIYLDYSFTEIIVDIKKGLSFMDIIALNRGSLGGNTGGFLIYDDQGKLLVENYWDNIDTGVRSKFKIIKEK